MNMLTDKEIENIAKAYIAKKAENSKKDLILSPEPILKKQYGNVFYYNSRKFIEERDIDYALLGNGPFLVEKNTGKIFQFGTAESEEYYLNEYEAGRRPPVADE